MKRILTLLTLVLINLSLFANDGDVKKTTVDGIEWTYTVGSETDKICDLINATNTDTGEEVYYPVIDVNTTGSVTIPSSLDGYTVASIGDEAFRGCKFSAVTIPSSVTYISDRAFVDCSLLTSVTCEGSSFDISETAFEGLYNQITVYVPVDYGKRYLDRQGWSKFSKLLEKGVEERLPRIQEMVMYLMDQLYSTSRELEEKATESEMPDLYRDLQKLQTLLDYFRYKIATATTMGEVRELEAITAELHQRLYVLQENIRNFTPLTPLDTSTTDFSKMFTPETRIHGSVIGNILFVVGDGEGGYDDQKGCLEITKTTANDTMAELEFKSIYGDVFQGQFTGVVLRLPKGKGTLKVDAETTGYMILVVKIGHADPFGGVVERRNLMMYSFDLEEESNVYIYAGIRDASQAKGIRKANEESENVLRLYGVQVEKESTGIEEIPSVKESFDVFNLSGQKVRSQAKDLNGLPAGVYIVGGKKVVVK